MGLNCVVQCQVTAQGSFLTLVLAKPFKHDDNLRRIFAVRLHFDFPVVLEATDTRQSATNIHSTVRTQRKRLRFLNGLSRILIVAERDKLGMPQTMS